MWKRRRKTERSAAQARVLAAIKFDRKKFHPRPSLKERLKEEVELIQLEWRSNLFVLAFCVAGSLFGYWVAS